MNKMYKLQRLACKLILSQGDNGPEESLKRLDMLSFDQSVYLNKAKIMYKVYNNLAPNYSQELFHMSPSLDLFVKRCINWMKY